MIYRALVRDSRDPSKKGRVKVAIPQLSGRQVTDWVWPVINSGFLVVPKAGEQVWVAFEGGDPENPVWLGKTAVTGTYRTSDGPVGDVSLLLDRVKELEDALDALTSRVSALESTAHSH